MSPKAERIVKEAMELPETDRADIVSVLMTGAASDSEPALDDAWAAQIKRRIDDIDSGKVKMIPGEQVLEKMRSRLRQAGRDV